MNLIVDVGNTLIKMAVFDSDKIISYRKIPMADFAKNVKSIFSEYFLIQNAIVSNVGAIGHEEIAMLCVFCKVHVLSSTSKTPFKNSYAHSPDPRCRPDCPGYSSLLS